MISTQPGSTPLASFKILSLEETESHGSYSSGNDIGESDICRQLRRNVSAVLKISLTVFHLNFEIHEKLKLHFF
jgi:hypothetical protein